MSRKDTIRKRCIDALVLSKNLSIFIRKNKISRELAVIIYNTVVFPMYVHGLKVRTLTRANRRRLRRYERSMLSNMVRYSQSNNSSITCKELLRGRSITRRIKVLRICYWGHIKRRSSTHMLHTALTYRLPKRKIGRPSYTYQESLKEAFSKYQLTREEWHSLVHDKHALKAVSESIYTDCINDTSSEEDFIPMT